MEIEKSGKSGELPIGFAMGMAMNEEARTQFSNMSEERRKRVEDSSRNVKSKYEMQELLNEVAEGKI